MATIKSYTDLEQSRKLAEFLPLESADMRFCFSHTLDGRITGHYPMIGNEPSLGTVPCWSLSALLGVLSLPDLIQDKAEGELFWQCSVYDKDDTLLCETYDNNPIDACVSMIERLHELNLM